MKFFRLNEKYKDVVLQWFSKDHVKAFYCGEGLQNTLNNIELYIQGINNNGRYSFDHWVALMNGEPFGFLMTSLVEGPYDTGDPYNKWFSDDGATYTLDLLIGPEKYLGKGLASDMIRQFIVDRFSDAAYFLIDPAMNNPKAIHLYEKAGFKKVDEFVPSYDPILHIMMR